jgi:benzoyl-CoA-dihydrodiol lyase
VSRGVGSSWTSGTPSASATPGYELKLNSYDLGVDIELADASSACASSTPRCAVVVVGSTQRRTASSAPARTS